MKKSKSISTLTTVLFLMTCTAAAFDTQLFVYPSLSRSLLMECGLLLMSFVALIHSLSATCVGGSEGHASAADSKRTFTFTSPVLMIIILLWVLYIIIHGRLSPVTEVYRMTYLCVTLVSIVPLSYCMRAGLITKRSICYGLLLIAAVHIVCTLAQWVGLMTPENTLYPVTGCCDNPSVTALYLAGCLPLCNVLGKKLRWTFIVLSLLCIALLRCRTAYVGVCVEAAAFIIMNVKARMFVKSHKWAVFTVVSLCVTIGSVKMYSMKRDSADGRMLIWRLSAAMIADKPLGHGYGLFAKHYNHQQAEYFAEAHGTETERRTASYTAMAYNDYLEHGVDGGVIGMLFLMGFYILTVTKTKTKTKAEKETKTKTKTKAEKETKTKTKTETAILSAFAVMSLTNFVCATIQPWLLLTCTAAMVMSQGKSAEQPRRFFTVAIPVALLVLTSFLAVMVCSMTQAQLRLHRIAERMDAGGNIPDADFAALEQGIYSSEAYWTTRMNNSMLNKNHVEARKYAQNALSFTTTPPLLASLSQCDFASSDTASAIRHLETACDIQPTMLYPKLYLMRIYHAGKDIGNACRMAREILSTKVRVDNEEATHIRMEAKYIIDKYKQEL